MLGFDRCSMDLPNSATTLSVKLFFRWKGSGHVVGNVGGWF